MDILEMENNILKSCTLCPRNCKVNRLDGKFGFCQAGEYIKIATSMLHFWEEPCISGSKGSGAIFFSYCNLKCIYCQNYDISTNNYGHNISLGEFSRICLNLEQKGANNINLVTPTPFVPQIIKGIKLARNHGLSIPIVYNTSSYENIDTIKSLKDTVNIYLADLKYYDDSIAQKYSNAIDYFKYATDAILEMYSQVDTPIIKNGIMQQGLIVRHLILPNHIDDSKKIIKYLYDTYKDNIYISIMNQYTPLKYVKNIVDLNRKVTEKEYDEVINYAYDLGIRKAFIQEGDTAKESFIPNFKD